MRQSRLSLRSGYQRAGGKSWPLIGAGEICRLLRTYRPLNVSQSGLVTSLTPDACHKAAAV